MRQRHFAWVWRSLVARMNGVHEAGSSSLLTQTKQGHPSLRGEGVFFSFRGPRRGRAGRPGHPAETDGPDVRDIRPVQTGQTFGTS